MKYFWLTTMLVILEIKISLINIKKSLYQCHPPYNRWVSSHRVLSLKFLSTYNVCIIYLHLIDACLKVTIAIFYFCYSKNPSDVIKNIFNSISICFWKKISLLTNIRKKTGYKESKSLFFWRHEKWPHFSLKSLSFSIRSQIPF